MTRIDKIIDAKPHRLLSIEPDATVYEALCSMALYDVGALVVADRDRLVGVFSERDYARKVILLGKSSKETLVREVMVDKVPRVTPQDTVDQCMALMTKYRMRHLPVLDDDGVTAVISIGDLVKAKISEQSFVIRELENYLHT
jgi:CBS domain-containing protein